MNIRMKRGAALALTAALLLAGSAQALFGLGKGKTETPVSENAPAVRDLEIRTYRGIPYQGQLEGTDPDGGELTFAIDVQPKKGTVTVDTKSVVISASLYQSLGAIFRLVTEQVQDLDGSTAGLDGIVYFFSSTDAKGKEQMGRKWSPEKGTLMERLVLVCQSAYMLSRGENISEQTLAVEAAALLKALQQRTKEEPDAYKRPMYIGIYPVGPRSKTLSGRQVEEPAHFSAMTPEEYIASEMVYPSGLLEKNVSGYALCEFTIDKEGVILRPHILRSTHPEFAEEALRIVKGMPKWSPALVGGKPADSNYTLYVPFRPQLYRNK